MKNLSIRIKKAEMQFVKRVSFFIGKEWSVWSMMNSWYVRKKSNLFGCTEFYNLVSIFFSFLSSNDSNEHN